MADGGRENVVPVAHQALKQRARAWFESLRDRMCAAFEAIEDAAAEGRGGTSETPPPLEGEGQGEGRARPLSRAERTPPPGPLPQGEGVSFSGYFHSRSFRFFHSRPSAARPLRPHPLVAPNGG